MKRGRTPDLVTVPEVNVPLLLLEGTLCGFDPFMNITQIIYSTPHTGTPLDLSSTQLKSSQYMLTQEKLGYCGFGKTDLATLSLPQ